MGAVLDRSRGATRRRRPLESEGALDHFDGLAGARPGGPLDQSPQVDAEAEHGPVPVGYHDRHRLGGLVKPSGGEHRFPQGEQGAGCRGELDSRPAQPHADLELEGQAVASQVVVPELGQAPGGQGCELREILPVPHGAQCGQGV